MRYTKNHRAESRTRILEVASRQFRAAGAEAVRVSDVMEAAGMTVGGFYKHFDNKEQLLEEAIATGLQSLSRQIADQASAMPRNEALRWVIRYYLSEEHLREPEWGCALAALGTEMARLPTRVQQKIRKSLDDYADQLRHLMPGKTELEQKTAFRVLFPSMAGCLMTARTYGSSTTRHEILSGARTFFESAFCGEDVERREDRMQ